MDSSLIFFSSSSESFLSLSAPKAEKRALENSPYLERENRDKKW
jgi:hypothetical protein